MLTCYKWQEKKTCFIFYNKSCTCICHHEDRKHSSTFRYKDHYLHNAQS